MPIEFFKNHRIISSKEKENIVFRSSGTSGMQRAEHYVANLAIYEQSFLRGFRYFVGQPEDYAILALLPSYSEKGDSSLVPGWGEVSAGGNPIVGGHDESGIPLFLFENKQGNFVLFEASK